METITRQQMLDELDIRTRPDGRKRIFSIKFVTADGKLVNKQAVGADGMATVAMQKLPKGVCIIKSQYQTIKINNK